MAGAKGKKKPGAKRTVVVVGKRHTHHTKKRKKSSVSGTTHHTKKRKKRSHSMLGGTGKSSLKQIAIMAIGVGTGAAITHIILRPVEKKLTDKWPMIGKFIAAGEVFLGGLFALKAKGDFMKSLGVGILAGGVHGLMKQANIYKSIPMINGVDNEFSEIRVPISGSLDNMLAGILEDSRRDVRTQVVAGSKHTMTIADTREMELDRSPSSVADTDVDEYANYPVKGMFAAGA